MLAVAPAISSNGEERDENFLLEDINFDDIFVGFDDGDILPGLEIDPSDIFTDFSFSRREESVNTAPTIAADSSVNTGKGKDPKNQNTIDCRDLSQEEVVSARTEDDGMQVPVVKNKALRNATVTSGKGNHGKKKAKVDWTPELHRRFVQAVEQLGVDKAVPSRILELMGIDCLTRHNIASHLQKYRSHRKHFLAREAEAASWSHRRQLYTNGHGNGAKNVSMNPNWPAPPPIIGFPPPMQQPFRPLHVWGHPSVEHPQLVPVWPRPPWAPPRPPHAPPVLSQDPSYWHQQPYYQRPLTQGTPCFPPPPLMPAMRFPAAPVPRIPPNPIFRPTSHNAAPAHGKHLISHIQIDVQPSNESIDAAIGDVLAKPWLPLPLGLKPPSLEGVMVELQKKGVANVPLTCG